MIKLEKLSLEEINTQPSYIDQIMSLFDNDISGNFYKYTYNGTERWLYELDGYCTILGNDGEYILYTSFYVNKDDYSIPYMEFDEFCAGVDDGEMLLWKNDDTISESLRTVNRSAQANNDGYSGLIVHHQRNTESGDEILVSYQNQYREDGHIFSCNLKNPFVVCFIDGKTHKVTSYLNFKTNRDYMSYDVITIKEYGLSEFLANGSFALQRSHEINRYFKILHQKKDGTCIIGVLVNRAIKTEEMEQMIKDKGFRLEVPEYVINYYNGGYEECDEYKELALALREYELEHTGDKKLRKVDKDGNSTL